MRDFCGYATATKEIKFQFLCNEAALLLHIFPLFVSGIANSLVSLSKHNNNRCLLTLLQTNLYQDTFLFRRYVDNKFLYTLCCKVKSAMSAKVNAETNLRAAAKRK